MVTLEMVFIFVMIYLRHRFYPIPINRPEKTFFEMTGTHLLAEKYEWTNWMLCATRFGSFLYFAILAWYGTVLYCMHAFFTHIYQLLFIAILHLTNYILHIASYILYLTSCFLYLTSYIFFVCNIISIYSYQQGGSTGQNMGLLLCTITLPTGISFCLLFIFF